MLEAARKRLVAPNERITYVLADLTDPKWVEHVVSFGGGSFDLAVSAIVIQ